MGRLDLRIGPGRMSLDGAELRMLAYNGSVPGASLHIDQGSDITVQITNDGDAAATVDWHGLRLDNRHDGSRMRSRRRSRSAGPSPAGYGFPDAGFYWYHPHRFACSVKHGRPAC